MVRLILVEKGGDLVESKVKEFSLESLYKKCKFRKEDGFQQRALWKVKLSGAPYHIALFARDFGKAGMENKYDLPPPVDQTLYFGVMSIVSLNPDDHSEAIDLDLETWNKVYEKLFGGFHNLADTALEDEEEEDELADLPAEMKTKHGYLKDDFIVDDNECITSNDNSVTCSPESFTDDHEEYESELDFEEYEYMDDSASCEEEEEEDDE